MTGKTTSDLAHVLDIPTSLTPPASSIVKVVFDAGSFAIRSDDTVPGRDLSLTSSPSLSPPLATAAASTTDGSFSTIARDVALSATVARSSFSFEELQGATTS